MTKNSRRMRINNPRERLIQTQHDPRRIDERLKKHVLPADAEEEEPSNHRSCTRALIMKTLRLSGIAMAVGVLMAAATFAQSMAGGKQLQAPRRALA
jgi:hypothetical protein